MTPWKPIATNAVLAAVLLLVGWRVLGLGMADALAGVQPERALQWRADHPHALLVAAEQLATSEPGKAAAFAREGLRQNPLEGRAFRVLGHIAQAGGEQQEVVGLYEIAALRSPRDVQTHAWLERHYLTSGQLPQALHHADMMLRVQPQTKARQYPVLQALAAMPQAQGELAVLLGKRPPWRQSFIGYLSLKAPDSQAVSGLVTRLRKIEGGLDETEMSLWLDRLNRDRRWGEAYITWASSLGAAKQSELANVFNGGFEHEPGNSGFDWRFGKVPGAYIERLATTGAGGNLALRISFEDRRVPFDHVRQLLALPPGSYLLTGRYRADGLRSTRGLVWSVACADDNQQLAAAEPVSGRTPWRKFSMSFHLPEGRCAGQWLKLSVPSRIRAEQRIGGQAWFDDLRIVRQDTASG